MSTGASVVDGCISIKHAIKVGTKRLSEITTEQFDEAINKAKSFINGRIS
jgi:hypothetical protein